MRIDLAKVVRELQAMPVPTPAETTGAVQSLVEDARENFDEEAIESLCELAGFICTNDDVKNARKFAVWLADNGPVLKS